VINTLQAAGGYPKTGYLTSCSTNALLTEIVSATPSASAMRNSRAARAVVVVAWWRASRHPRWRGGPNPARSSAVPGAA